MKSRFMIDQADEECCTGSDSGLQLAMGRINETAKDGGDVAVFNTAGEVTVPTPSGSRPPYGSSAWGPDYTNRLFHLFSAFSALRQDSRHLVDQLRGSLDQMRELRVQLRAQTSGTKGNGVRKTWTDDLCERYGLTRRELEVAKLLALGKSNAAIAEKLRISGHTARHHTQRILSKLAVHSRGEAGAKLRE
jgi:DNA-binding CsgD family transcriptional regulator